MRGVIEKFSVGSKRNASARRRSLAAVDVFALAAARIHRVDEARQFVVVADDAQRRGVADRHVDMPLQSRRRIRRPSASTRELDGAAELADLGLRGDVAQRARDRAGAEQRALRAAQHFEALEVEQIEVGREQRDGDRRLVEIDADRIPSRPADRARPGRR